MGLRPLEAWTAQDRKGATRERRRDRRAQRLNGEGTEGRRTQTAQDPSSAGTQKAQDPKGAGPGGRDPKGWDRNAWDPRGADAMRGAGAHWRGEGGADTFL
jgi:hypothetical protein